MSWRIVVIESKAKLDYKMDYLVVRTENKTSRIHLSEISTLIIGSTAVSLTAYLLAEMMKNKIKVIFCDEKKNPLLETCGYYGSHDTSAKVRLQVKWSDSIKGDVWREIVRAKINGQRAVLPDDAIDELALLSSYASDVQANDITNREGHAAKVYFNTLFGKEFSRSDENVTNAALNYGYSLLLSSFNREVVAAGYITQIGIHHDNMFNRFNLSCDLMEPFRPFVDRKVLELKPQKFEQQEKLELVNLLNQYVSFEGNKQYMNNALRLYAHSVFNALNEQDVSQLKFPTYEL